MNTSKRTRRSAVIAAAVIGTVVAAGAAWAAFGTIVVAGAVGGAENVKTITVTGEQLVSPLLPGESSNVKLTIVNPNKNVKAQITAITPGAVEVGGVADADKQTCKDYVITNQGTLPASLPTLAKDGSADVIVADGVKFGDAPLICQGMTWKTYWDVKFHAVR